MWHTHTHAHTYTGTHRCTHEYPKHTYIGQGHTYTHSCTHTHMLTPPTRTHMYSHPTHPYTHGHTWARTWVGHTHPHSHTDRTHTGAHTHTCRQSSPESKRASNNLRAWFSLSECLPKPFSLRKHFAGVHAQTSAETSEHISDGPPEPLTSSELCSGAASFFQEGLLPRGAASGSLLITQM